MSSSIDISLRLLSALANFYRNNYSVIGRVEKMEEDIKDADELHREFVDTYLEKYMDVLDSDDLPDGDYDDIDLDDLGDRETQIRM